MAAAALGLLAAPALVVAEERLPAGARRGTFEIEYLGAADATTEYEVTVASDRDLVWLTRGDSTVTVIACTPP